jgi:hypothetical protein
VLDKLRDMAGPDADVLESDADGDTIVIGPNADYRADVLRTAAWATTTCSRTWSARADRAHTVLVRQRQRARGRHQGRRGESDEELAENSSRSRASASPGGSTATWRTPWRG